MSLRGRATTRFWGKVIALSVAAVLVAVLGLPSGCSRASVSANAITLAGSTSVQPFAEVLGDEFMADHKGQVINVQGGGSSAGIQAARSEAAQIGMSSRKLKKDEADLTPITIAWDAIAIIVNPVNPISAITTQQVRDIFSGKIARWSQLGGKNVPITVISREEGSGTRGSFDEMVLKELDITPRALFQDSNGAVREIVANDPNAIGYMSLGLVDQRVKALPLDGIQPSTATVLNSTYTLVRPFLFVLKAKATGESAAFIDFVLGPKGQDTLAREGLVPVKPATGGGK